MLATHFLVFIASDVSNLHDSVNYLLWTVHCCTPKGAEDPMCAPIIIPDDDPVHRFTNIRCMNLTKPMTFQTSGCLENDIVPERIVTATPTFDLSTLYGISSSPSPEIRTYKGGKLKIEVEDGRIWPPNMSERESLGICIKNKRPYETRCHNVPVSDVNTLLSLGIVTIWFWRLHNHIAENLAKINPCWNDEKLFFTARDINIAIESQILYYELLPMLMGYDNLVNSGVITENPGFRDTYNSSSIPQISIEFPFVLRWLHKMQEGILKMYDTNGKYVKEIPIGNLTLRPGYMAVDNNIDYITQGSFRQASAKIDDHIVDPDMAQLGVGPLQVAADIPADDMAKNCQFMLPPYVKYVQHCFGKSIQTFDDLNEFFEPGDLERLAELYEDVEDIDLLAAIWIEGLIKNGHVPQTFYCLVVDQLLRTINSDRHWYERPNRPHAFTPSQLQEVRKVTVARMLCDVGDSVSHIQPHAFQRPGPENEIQHCEDIPDIFISAWRDTRCEPINNNR